MIPIHPPSSGTPPRRSIVAQIRDNAAAHPDKLALVCGQTRLTWAAFDERINRVANLLLADGMAKGDRIAILSPNSAEYAVLFMGIYPKPFTDVIDPSVQHLLQHVAQSKLP